MNKMSTGWKYDGALSVRKVFGPSQQQRGIIESRDEGQMVADSEWQ